MAPLRGLQKNRKGQALVEFTLALPVLLLIMMAAYMVGAAMYTGANASTAVRTALEKKYEYADSDQALNDLRNAINSYDMGTFQITGDNVDSIALAFTTRETPIIVAQKAIKFPMFPSFTFVVTQGINGDLMRNNTDPFTVSVVVPFDSAIPQQAAAIDPAVYGWVAGTTPMYVPMDPTCTPDLTVFNTATNTCGDATCAATNAALLVQDHVNLMTPMNACAGGSYHDPNDVTFDSSTPNY